VGRVWAEAVVADPAREDRDGDGGGEHPKSADLEVELGVVGEERHGGGNPRLQKLPGPGWKQIGGVVGWSAAAWRFWVKAFLGEAGWWVPGTAEPCWVIGRVHITDGKAIFAN